ncbi:hypothetical protein IWQ48_000868 [Labrenzia sp. EL_13]|nr:hypothetical protein [Labrenzia sp. EL_13]
MLFSRLIFYFAVMSITIFVTVKSHAVTLADVEVDRTSVVLTGSGFLDATIPGRISITGFGLTVIDPATSTGYLPSIIFNTPDSGTADFTIPFSTSFLTGTIEDASQSTGLISLLLSETGTGDLAVVDISSPFITGANFALIAPVANVEIDVFGAKRLQVIPLPPAGAMLMGAFGLFGIVTFRRKRG